MRCSKDAFWIDYGSGVEKIPCALGRSRSYVYIIHKPNYGVKVGHTENPKGRLARLRSAHGRDLTVAYIKECPYNHDTRIERRTHALLKAHRISGEWFKVSVEDAVFALHQAYVNYVLEDTCHPSAANLVRRNFKVDRGFWRGDEAVAQ